jgi:hypothetical protein
MKQQETVYETVEETVDERAGAIARAVPDYLQQKLAQSCLCGIHGEDCASRLHQSHLSRPPVSVLGDLGCFDLVSYGCKFQLPIYRIIH